jgi:predicted cobalt transporter CbtA
VDARGLIAAAVAAGVPAGLLYAAANQLLAIPPLLRAEAFEGPAAGGWDAARALWGLAGSVGLATAFSLVITPVVRALGPPTALRGLLVGAAAFASLLLLPALATRPGPPGLEAAAPLAARQGAWWLAVLASLAAVGLGAAVRRLAGRRRGACVLAWGSGLGLWAACAWAYVRTGGAAPMEAGPVPEAVVTGFREAMLISNGLLFLGLALLIPVALRRLAP